MKVKNKIKNLSKRLLVITLATSLALSSPTQAFASAWAALGTSGGGSGGVGGNQQGNFQWSTGSGYKITTYLLATTTLNYMLDLNPELQKYIVDSRPGMVAFKTDNGISAEDVIKTYVQAADYTNRENKSYMSDFFQQLGRPFIYQTSYAEANGYMMSETSPDVHLSAIDSGTSVEDVINQCRTDVELVPVTHMSTEVVAGSKQRVTYLGNTIFKGFFVSLADMAYWFGTNRDNVTQSSIKADQGISGFRHIQGNVSGIANSSIAEGLLASEKYSAGMVFNTVLSDGIAIDTGNVTPQWALNMNTYALSPYAEFTTVQRKDSQSAANHPQNCKNITITGHADFLTNTSASTRLVSWIGNRYYGKKEFVGGITYRALIPSTTTQEVRQYAPFPAITVRHIDKTLLEASADGKTNTLLRDSIAWTVPLALGLAIEDDFAKAAL